MWAQQNHSIPEKIYPFHCFTLPFQTSHQQSAVLSADLLKQKQESINSKQHATHNTPHHWPIGPLAHWPWHAHTCTHLAVCICNTIDIRYIILFIHISRHACKPMSTTIHLTKTEHHFNGNGMCAAHIFAVPKKSCPIIYFSILLSIIFKHKEFQTAVISATVLKQI